MQTTDESFGVALKTCEGTTEKLLRCQHHTYLTEELRNHWKTAQVLHSTTFTPKRTHRGAITSCNTDNHQRTAEEPLKNRWGAGTTHTPENRWETSEEPQKYYTALQPPATDWVTDGNTFWRWVLASWMFCWITVNLSRYKHRQAKSLLLWQSESKTVCAHKHKLYIINELVELL